MRSKRDVKFSNRHNQTKLLILKSLVHTQRWLKSNDIAELCCLTPNNASRQLTKLTGQGYIHRRDVGRRYYRYKHLKHQGERTLRELWVRQWLIDKTDDERIDLNVKHSIPDEAKLLTVEAQQAFNSWFYGREIA